MGDPVVRPGSGARHLALWLCVAVAGASCGGGAVPSTAAPAAEASAPQERGDGVRLVYGLDGGAAEELADARDLLRRRLQAAGLVSPEVWVELESETIAVDLFGAAAADVERVRQIVERRPRLELRVVEHDSAFMKALYAHAHEDDRAAALGVGVDVDVWSHDAAGRRFQDYYLVAAERDAIERYLGELAAADRRFAVDDGHEIGYELRSPIQPEDEATWRTYYLSSRAELDGGAVAHAEVVISPMTNRPVVSIELDAGGATRFAEVTGAHVGEKLAVLFDDRVYMAPVVMERIAGGRLTIAMGSGDFGQAERDAAAMVDSLRSGALPPLRLLSRGASPRARP